MRRETWEETAIEVGEVMYHSSQPWPGIAFTTLLWLHISSTFRLHVIDLTGNETKRDILVICSLINKTNSINISLVI